MESSNEKNQECSLQIDTIWSEADENLLVKEEIVSDIELDCNTSSQENNSSCLEHNVDTQAEDEGSCSGCNNTTVLPSWQPLKKKAKNKAQKSEETETVINHKLSCLHDTKNFKIVKRRLRCGNCRSLVCPECCKVMIPNLQSHFLGSGIGSSGTFLCKLCGIIFHSLCALQAHIRIHTMDTPYVCPDCGLIYNNIYFLILHLLNKCYHVYKIVRYKCKHCTGAYFTPETFVKHIQETHIHCVFRCLYCSSLFNNYDEFNYHMENLHQKQKVQYLNYFRCSLCSNMVIPRFMYHRHIAQHRENSEFYEIDYQCLCGEIYSLIGAFRSHFTYCGKKGLLPPRWSFLQRKLRTQDVLHHENFPNKEVVVQSLPIYSNSEAEYNNLTLVRSVDSKTVMVNDEGNSAKGDVSLQNNFVGHGQVSASLEMNRKVCKKLSEKWNEESGACCNNLTGLINSTSLNEFQTQGCEKEDQVCDQQVSENGLASTDPEQYSKDIPREPESAGRSISEGVLGCRINKESEQIDGDMYKIYDHIPCDHLGYVIKAQGLEPHPRKACQVNDIVPDKIFSPENYKIVTELDEKTGLISTKTVPAEESEVDDEEENINDDDCDDLESLTFNMTAKAFGSDKIKFKVGNSLSCPFCIVLFQKHNLTFQQFRLHLESYHPDAALNITVNKDEKPQEKACIQHSDNAEAESKTNDCPNLKEDVACGKFEFTNNNSSNSSNCEKIFSPEEGQNELNPGSISTNSDSQLKGNETNSNTINDKTILCDDREANSEKEPNILLKSLNEEVYPSQKQTVDEPRNKNHQSWKLDEFRVETVGVSTDVGSDLRESDPSKNKKKDGSNLENNGGDFNIEERKVGNTYSECTEGRTEELDEEQRIKGASSAPHCFEFSEKKTHSELEYEGETSKDSNWSVISAKDSKTNSLDESKPEEKERSRRESEVWSEFYESLMLAEKLKKKKKESPDDEKKKKSVVSDYSAKRIVKKPKRYRESSESADSNEYSDSDDEFLLKGDFIGKISSEDIGDAEDQLNKKQLLLNKLENVDGRFVDYLFDVVTKKEKLFELYKKHLTLRANRYSHDLRSYRKKVLNGIKQRGRPLKILRYHELLKKKDLIVDRNNKEGQPLRKRGEFSPESKANEKKRGRPRKHHDPGRLKERRRSDKEVNFIEKNFEREENDFSPSKRKRKLSSKLQYYRKMSDEKDDFSSGQVISNKPPDSSRKFACAVCKEVFPGYSELREHIVVHRMEENTYQCLECGECFVVRPSLEKHLHAFHKIKNTDKYITDNQCCNIKKEVIEVENEPLKENQCKVCKDQFERPIDLTKHFRIHGMAFLKEFRKEGKSNEKRND